MEDQKKSAEELVDDLLNRAEEYGFQVPYDGSNKFYDDERLWRFIREETPKVLELYAAQKVDEALREYKDTIEKINKHYELKEIVKILQSVKIPE